MKTARKVGLVISLILAISIFVSSCVCIYLFNLHEVAYWWIWFIVCWVVDIIVASIMFNTKYASDETKAFWLLIIILLPILGAIIVIFVGFRKRSQKGGISENHAILLQAIFSAQKSIKFYANSFFVSNDTFNALNFCSFKDIKIDICVSKQNKKYKNKLMLYDLDKFLEEKVNLGIISNKITNNFLIIDDKKVLAVEKNFNFKNMFDFNKITQTTNIDKYLKTFKETYGYSVNHKINKTKKRFFVRFRSGFLNIFYPFM